jgi:hypothetical protein
MFRRALLAIAGVLALATSAQATNYGDLHGPNYNYLNISENDSQIFGNPPVASTPTGLFGAPQLTPPGSDTLSFPNLSFGTLVANGQFELQDGKLQFDMTPANNGVFIHALTFDEGGAWRVLGPDSAITPATASMSEATLLFNDLRITSVNGVAISPIIVSPTFTETATTQTGPLAHVALSPGDVNITSAGGNSTGLWDVTASFNIDSALAAAGRAGQRVTGISVGLDNQLFSQTSQVQGLTLASIDKKHFTVNLMTTVPEPSTMILGAIGAMGLVVARRKLKKASKA